MCIPVRAIIYSIAGVPTHACSHQVAKATSRLSNRTRNKATITKLKERTVLKQKNVVENKQKIPETPMTYPTVNLPVKLVTVAPWHNHFYDRKYK